MSWLLMFFALHAVAGFKQGPAVSCTDAKKKILCLPKDYSKFDLPYRNDFNIIDIGEPFAWTLRFD